MICRQERSIVLTTEHTRYIRMLEEKAGMAQTTAVDGVAEMNRRLAKLEEERKDCSKSRNYDSDDNLKKIVRFIELNKESDNKSVEKESELGKQVGELTECVKLTLTKDAEE